jgi:hypothetical protein
MTISAYDVIGWHARGVTQSHTQRLADTIWIDVQVEQASFNNWGAMADLTTVREHPT